MKHIHTLTRNAAVAAMTFTVFYNVKIGAMPQSLTLIISIVLLSYIISFLRQYVNGGDH